MRLEYGGKEKGPSTTACISDDHISLDVLPDLGIPEGSWTKNGWELTPLVQPPTVSFKFYALMKAQYLCVVFSSIEAAKNSFRWLQRRTTGATLCSYTEVKKYRKFTITGATDFFHWTATSNLFYTTERTKKYQ